MRIRTQAQLFVSIAFLIVLAMSIIYWINQAKLDDIAVVEERTLAAASVAASLQSLTHEYFVYSEARVAQQWLSQQTALVDLLQDGASSHLSIDPVSLSKVNELTDLFQRLKVASSNDSSINARQKEFLAQQLLITTEVVSDAIKRWASEVREARISLERGFKPLTLAIPLLMLVILLLLGFLLYHRVLLPLQSLHRVVVAVSKGDLSLRSDYRRNDELGDLSRTFDAMAVDLVTELRKEITENKKMEEEKEILTSQLEQSRKMEALGVMAGGMAHNFNNNLSVILGNIELAQMKQPHDSDTTPLLGNAKIAAQRSRDLIRRIIIYSRNKEQNKTPMLLLHVVNEAVKLVKPTLPSTINVQLSINPACDSVMIHTDASQIQEVLLELCNNAVQAMKEKGDLALSLKPVNLVQADIPSQYDADPGRYVKLCVQDSGCGMPAEILNKIFDPFFTTKEEYEGAGMGLSAVQGIVVEHGGLIKVDSTPGQGSTFTLYIPVSDEAEVTQEAHAEANLANGTEHILLIDDEQYVANVCGAMLEHLGYKVTVMISSVEALELFKGHPDNFDLVMTDQTMPRLSGVELAKELLVIRPKIPIILCSGDSARFTEADAKEAGISAFCMKPMEMKQLATVVREVLDTSEQPSVTV